MIKPIEVKKSETIIFRLPIEMRNQLQKREIETSQDLSKVLRDVIAKGLK